MKRVKAWILLNPFFILKFYIMITKFKDLDDPNKVIEFTNLGATLGIYVSDFDSNQSKNKTIPLTLSKENLFDLIGQLLRIQSQLKEG